MLAISLRYRETVKIALESLYTTSLDFFEEPELLVRKLCGSQFRQTRWTRSR